MHINSRNQLQFEAYFQPVPISSSPPMMGICDPDFDEVARRLQRIGFIRHTASYLHGERGWDWFEHPDKKMVIEVYTRGESSKPIVTTAYIASLSNSPYANYLSTTRRAD